MNRRILTRGIVYTALVASVGALVAAAYVTSVNTPSARERNRPRSIAERMLEKRAATAFGDRAQERTGGGDDDTAEAGNRESFDQWFLNQRIYPAESLPANARDNALNQSKAKNKDLRGAPGGGGPMWKPLGPSTIPDGQTDASAGQLSPVSGRLNAIATHPFNPNIVYAGGAQGGVWKTTNALSAQPSWTPLTDQEASLSVGAIAIDPVNPDIIYVGTGEANRACDSYYGQGMLRSADGGKTWTLLGNTGSPFNNPGPFSGKAIAKILIDPLSAGSTTATTLWAATTIGIFSGATYPTCATPSGAGIGLWRSSDSGATWQLQTLPGAPNFSVMDAAIDPNNPNIVYVAVRSTAVYKSVNARDAVATYAAMTTGFPAGSTVTPMRRINVGIGGPGAPNMLYAAIENGAAGDRLFGLYQSANGGTTWSHVDAGFNGAASYVNVDIDPGAPVTLRGQVTRVSGPSFVTDGSWSGRRLLVPLTAGGRAVLSRTIQSVVDGDHLLLTTTTGFDGTAPVSAQYSVGNYPPYCDGQCFYDMTIAVDPADATGKRIYVGGNPHTFAPNAATVGARGSHTNWRSDDGGLTWASISQGDGIGTSLHTDDHAYAFGIDGSVYDGNDGGIWRSPDRGFSWVSMNTDIGITQFQGVAMHPTSNVLIGGTQDNGTNLHDPSVQAPPAWFHADFGDGGMAVIDQSTPSRMFHTYYNAQFAFMGPARSDVGGTGGPGSWPFVGAYFGYGPQYYNGMDPTDPVSFYAPLTQHPAFTPNVIYFGSNKVYRSADPQPFVFTNPPSPQPTSWKAVSPVLTKGAPSTGAYLSWIGVLPTLVNGFEVLYTGSSDGRVSVSANVNGTGVAAWTTIDKAPLPNRAVSQVLPAGIDPTGNTVFVTFSGFNGSTPTTPGHVFKSTTGLGAATWTNISGDLPDVPTNGIAFDDKTNTIYVATDIGVFQSLNGGAHWSQLDNGMPNVAVFMLAMNKSGRLVAATHGRGMFELLKSGGPNK